MVDTGLQIGIGLLEQAIFETSFASQFWLIQLTIIVATLLLITRKTSDWYDLALPVMLGWQTFGMSFSWIFYFVSTAMFVMNALSLAKISSALGAVAETLTVTDREGGLRQRLRNNRLRESSKRMNIREEMDKMRIGKSEEGTRWLERDIASRNRSLDAGLQDQKAILREEQYEKELANAKFRQEEEIISSSLARQAGLATRGGRIMKGKMIPAIARENVMNEVANMAQRKNMRPKTNDDKPLGRVERAMIALENEKKRNIGKIPSKPIGFPVNQGTNYRQFKAIRKIEKAKEEKKQKAIRKIEKAKEEKKQKAFKDLNKKRVVAPTTPYERWKKGKKRKGNTRIKEESLGY